ncbi:hypothetical protein RFI_39802, partial [Reticulomyxa filosa]
GIQDYRQKEYTYAKTRCDEVMTNVLQKMEANELVRIQTVGDCLRKWVVSPITFSARALAAQRNSDVTRRHSNIVGQLNANELNIGSKINQNPFIKQFFDKHWILQSNTEDQIQNFIFEIVCHKNNDIDEVLNNCPQQHCECKYMKGKLGKAQIDQLKVVCPRQMQTDKYIILCDFKGQIKFLNEQLYKNCTFKEYCWFKLFGCNNKLLNKFISMNNIINDIAAKRRLNEEFNRRIDILFLFFLFEALKKELKLKNIEKDSYNEKLLYFDVFRFKEFNIHKLIVTTIDYFQIFFAVIPFISLIFHISIWIISTLFSIFKSFKQNKKEIFHSSFLKILTQCFQKKITREKKSVMTLNMVFFKMVIQYHINSNFFLHKNTQNFKNIFTNLYNDS